MSRREHGADAVAVPHALCSHPGLRFSDTRVARGSSFELTPTPLCCSSPPLEFEFFELDRRLGEPARCLSVSVRVEGGEAAANQLSHGVGPAGTISFQLPCGTTSGSEIGTTSTALDSRGDRSRSAK